MNKFDNTTCILLFLILSSQKSDIKLLLLFILLSIKEDNKNVI